MHVPVLSSVRELDRAPRRFLGFTVFNVISWQCIMGPALVLLARRIDMPASWVGCLISFMPFSMLLVVVAVPLVTWLGSKRVMLLTWLLRNLAVSVVFFLPWALERYGPATGWYVLLGAILAFSVLRAVGSGGWFPWLHELVPVRQRGTYFSAEAGVTQLINVCVMLGQALLLLGNQSLSRFLVIYLIGIASGLLSLVMMYRVPGGGGIEQGFSIRDSYASYRRAWADRPFLQFVLVASLSFSAASWFGSALVMYLRDVLGMSSNAIMFMMAAGSAGVLLTIRSWGLFAEHSGSASAMSLGLIGHSAAALLCLVCLPGAPWTPWLLLPTIAVGSICGAAFWTSAHRAMLHYVQESGRIGYTNLWIVGTAVALGLTPVLAGQCIEHWAMNGFRFCFLLSGFAGALCALGCRLVVKDRQPLDRSLVELVNPELPVRVLARILWITLGLHPSSRRSDRKAA